MPKHELPKTYDFASAENRIYQQWEERGYFKPSNDPQKPGFDPTRKPFVISIPPANVTGELHLGHAMFLSMEDLMIRYHRMKGVPTLWVPGTDHAGIATQLQIERLLTQEGTTREEIGRDEFLRRTWAWKEKYGGIITKQVRRMGSSCDWSRERFTMDEGLSKAVREAFVRLYEKGLVYRGPRLINWSPGLRTAVSDLEVEYSDEQGTLYYFKYVLADNPSEFLAVATTRPETILGDSAVAVHPEDERYRKYIGRNVIVPMMGRVIPIIADEYVDREFGSGALKVTPGHDKNDYLIGQRHNLAFISVLDERAQINEIGGVYQGMDRFECRKKIWEDMHAAGLVIKEEPYKMIVPRSQRGGEIVEPMISTQWFVRIKPLAEAALAAVKDGRIRIVPEYFTKVYYNWMESIEDWCISRQLWWGHRIPIWYCDNCGKMFASRIDASSCTFCSSHKVHQDPDVLDTWFSSGLWPFSTLGWPEETADLKYFYPTSVLETGYDILFFWVARMIMDGLEFTGKIPFETVYLHGLIRDEHGQKMSKTKGNAIDPLIVMEEMGTDALRFTLLVGSTPGKDINLSVKKVEGNRNFANKIWNAGRFILGELEHAPAEPQKAPEWTLADAWIWARMQELIRTVDHLFETYQYGEAGRQIFDFFWSEFADWYIEIAKLQLSEGGDRAFYTIDTLIRVMDTCLRLLHPFTPFVTEEVWGYLKQATEEVAAKHLENAIWTDMLITAPYPQTKSKEGWEEQKMADFSGVQDVIRAIRNLRTEYNVKPNKLISAIIEAGNKINLLKSQEKVISALASLNMDELIIVNKLDEEPQGTVSKVVSGIEIFLPLAGLVDLKAEDMRHEKELAETRKRIKDREKRLAGEFAQRAPEALVEKERQKLETDRETEKKILKLRANIQLSLNRIKKN